ncbi:Protein phosphatase 2C [Halobacillus karajensis]|uniref:PPM-type phosphatase domain-containing protein n=1 Tax=Halobacillus karajensis TaxID=195088 RepID=A0A024P5I6_9BACI|nr:PP2C family serine/threonine-protein phosphatase [Halobacillus karajensis]CDQ20493.1 hypothetical protein BN982_02835 [Halobacillus karajensis]CDQ24038.1 hypothetical protein BN983_02302 [Halobacillus karajensis]CDQ27516.1 hypothetical protein BN981_01783 [Halobacillus karajensis]SEH90900.1 Protein phosphatase 2C [Halobacillus karajensis]
MKITSLQQLHMTSPAKKECEDALVINEEAGVYGVLDGATPLVPFEDEEGHNGAYLAANIFKDQLESLNAEDSLIYAVKQANQRLRKEMERYGVQTEKGEERWSTCVAVVKITLAHIEFVHLGDSMIIIGEKNGKCKVITKDTVKGISARAKQKREGERLKGRKLPEESHFNKTIHKLRYNRQLANVDGGYTVANGMKEVMDYLDKGVLRTQGIQDLFIMTDGLFHPELSLEESYYKVKQQGLRAYIDQLTQYLKERSLHVDDRSALWIQLK